MKKPDKQQWIILLVGAVVIVGFGAFRYIPIVRQKLEVQNQMDQQNQIMDEICSASVLLPELKQEKKQFEEKLLSFDQKVPQGRNFASLWRQIAEIMNQCGLSDQSVQPGPEIKSQQLCSIPVTIECKGSMQQVFLFFSSLEQINRLVRIEQVTLDRDGDLNSRVGLKAQAKVYYQPDDSENG